MKLLSCNKNYRKAFDENLKTRFADTYKFPSHDINKFILLLRKGPYSYEYIDDWEKSNKKPLPQKEDFYYHLNVEHITDPDYIHAKRVSKDFKTKHLR